MSVRDSAERVFERLWYRPRGVAFALARVPLGPASAVAALISRKRQSRHGTAPPVPVIAVGNLTAGGSGKTQVVLWLANCALGQGQAVAIVSKGYGGHAKSPTWVDPSGAASELGDEAVLLARRLPKARVLVARDRAAGVALAASAGATLVLIDDGLQQRAVEPTARVAVFGGDAPLGNGAYLPLGPLRDGLDSLRPTDLIWVHGPGAAAGLPRIDVRSRVESLGFVGVLADPPAAAKAPRRVLAFAGIARSDRFFTTLRESGTEVLGFVRFADHRPFSVRDANRLARRARILRADALVCTEKDLARWPAVDLSLPVLALRVDLEVLSGEPRALALLKGADRTPVSPED